MTIRRSKAIVRLRPFLPVIIGLSLGFSMSLVRMPLNEEECANIGSDHFERQLRSIDNINQNADLPGNGLKMDKGNGAAPPVYDTLEDFEPRIITDPALKPKINFEENKKKIVRTRYISTELGIREKLVVAALTSSKTVRSMCVAFNKTTAHHLTKLQYFIGSRQPAFDNTNFPTGMTFNIKKDGSITLLTETLTHLFDTFREEYDWFFLVTDETYLEADRLNYMLDHISINRRLYMGYPKNFKEGNVNIKYCSLDNGILLSRLLLLELIPHLDECKTNYKTEDASVWLGQCIFLSLMGSVECKEREEAMIFHSFNIEKNDLDVEKETSDDFTTALTVANVKDPMLMYKLHKRFSQIEIDKTYKEIEEIQDEIKALNPKLPESERELSWPIGINPPFKPSNRWDIIVWDYFTEDYTLTCPGEVPKCELSGIDKLDVQNILQIAMERLNEKYNKEGIILEKKKLVNGYRRFDPQRGMEYTLDILLNVIIEGESEEVELNHRVHLLRPLSQVEIIPMPYVTENAKIHIILPMTVDQRDQFKGFMENYAKVCLATGDMVELSIMFVYNPQDALKIHENDIFAGVKKILQEYETKYRSKLNSGNTKLIPWVSIKTEVPSQLKTMDIMAKKHPTNTLFFLSSVNAILDQEFLNRCRMNAIQGWQAFFPVPFSRYNPEILYKNQPEPEEVEIKPTNGHFDLYSFDENCFYNSDYMAARTKLSKALEKDPEIKASGDPMDVMDIYDLMIKYSDIHVFRAVEPQLKRRYTHRQCSQRSGTDLFQKCERSNAEGLASRTQLAMELYPDENEKKQK